MLKINIPNYKPLIIQNIVIDFNGTLAFDGKLIKGASEKIKKLTSMCNIHILTADTYGTINGMFENINVNIEIVKNKNGKKYKAEFISKLGGENVVAIGNGNIDSLMLKKACLGILIIGKEGVSTHTLLNSDLIVKDIKDALDLLIYPKRLIASLRG